MWALRRASFHLRNQCLSCETTRVCSVKSEIGSCYFENFITKFTQSQVSRRFHNTSSSSLVRVKSSRDDYGVLENHSSWHEARHGEESSEVLEGEKKSPKTGAISGLTRVLLSSKVKASKVLDKWVEAGNKVTPTDVSSTVQLLMNRRLFAKAFQLYEWLDSRHIIEFTENDYSWCVDLIAKRQSWFEAEEYIQQVPRSFRTEYVYTTLLRNYVLENNMTASEKLFYKMKGLFPLTAISYDQMLFLYKRTDRKKFADLIEFMEKENIKPSKTTYQILIDAGQYGNIRDMEQIFEKMKSNGVEPTLHNRASLAQYYAAAGLKNDAEALLKDMEGGDLVKNRDACYYLLPVYASLGRGDEVERVWGVCVSNPNLGECLAAIRAFGQLKRIKDAEAVFEKFSNIQEKGPSSYLYSILLNVYADHKMVTKGEDLFRRLRKGSVTVNMHAWDALMKLYLGVGEVEKADIVLEDVIRMSKEKPLFASFLKILAAYAARGDVHNAEKIFFKMRKARYTMRCRRPYRSLLYAYINANIPAVGFDKRLKEDNIVLDEGFARLLAQSQHHQAQGTSQRYQVKYQIKVQRSLHKQGEAHPRQRLHEDRSRVEVKRRASFHLS